jgi:hypothetical protein
MATSRMGSRGDADADLAREDAELLDESLNAPRWDPKEGAWTVAFPTDPVVQLNVFRGINKGRTWKGIALSRDRDGMLNILLCPRWRSRDFWTAVLLVCLVSCSFLLGGSFAILRLGLANRE